MKASELAESRVFIVGSDAKENMRTLGDILHKLSNAATESTFQKTIKVLSNSKNKYSYKKMLLENPYLYFTEFTIHSKFTEKLITKEHKKCVVIVDFQLVLEDAQLVNKLDNCVVIVVNNFRDTGILVETYKSTIAKKILVFKRGNLKMLQRHFYKKIVCPLNLHLNLFPTFDQFYKAISDEELDIRFLVLVNNQLKWN
ncbi:hypothetical protein EB118_02005 [bacterium]|nr:hypothetical protein [bacterium]NDC94191.1 hypothetical protein [bacterium]NDD83023.1 hypothetical protein [bacterium]NDG28861.1 hypothetical protein [bacterium]